MYTVIIADDEEELRKSVIEKVNWNDCGFKVIGEAENGIEALELAEQLEPDLILTDIKMPLMSGLELAKNVRELCPATQLVILSGYDDFEYAQTAIKYNIIRYLLKPISAEELEAELVKINEAMNERVREILSFGGKDLEAVKNRLDKTEFLLPLLMGNSEESPDDVLLRKRAEELEIIDEKSGSKFGVVVSKFKNKQGRSCTEEKHLQFVNAILGKYAKTESFFLNGRIATVIFTGGKDYQELLRLPLRELVQSSAKVLSQQCTIGVSRETDRFSLCGGAYFEAVSARRYTSDGTGNIRFIADQERGSESEFEYVEKTVFSLEQLLKVGSEEKLTAFFDGIYSSESGNYLDYMVIQVLATVYRTVSAITDKEALAELVNENPIYKKATFYDGKDKIKADLKKLCINAHEILSRNRKQDSEILCDRVVEIIDSEYGNEELSLTDVSARLSVSPNYLSTLIKKKKRVNFVTLLTDRRMKEAYELLMCSALRILEISERCGYSDQHYFSYCFKKYYGISPNKMRESNRS